MRVKRTVTLHGWPLYGPRPRPQRRIFESDGTARRGFATALTDITLQKISESWQVVTILVRSNQFI